MTRLGKIAAGAVLMAGTALGATAALTTPANAGVVVGVGVPAYPYYGYPYGYPYYGYPYYGGYYGPYVGVGWGCCGWGWRGGYWHGGYWHGGYWHGGYWHGGARPGVGFHGGGFHGR